ncbi:unnamed protein product [Bursaphelenchus okinawaensis]|uniref:G_PROTEIN_RECEP_F1_2 domain-containing protein n=1 Tax=Bursaphelenchus okinawaensis TaxID=465554 RepID=A0A811JRF9_9BILA|nr:unnamed protein product [Bursaphelenchus okinawaensis]CAG9080119.1 unnamed protein product [Bursaphelenchus okinawaensis]
MVNGSIAVIVSLTINSLFVYLLFTKTPKQLKHYARVMFIHVVNDTSFILAFYFVLPKFFPHNGQVFVILTNFSNLFGVYWSTWITAVYYFFEILQLAFLPLDFFYRYRVVCKQHIMSSKTLAIVVGVTSTVIFFQSMILSRLMLQQTPEYDITLRALLKVQKLPMYVATSTNPWLGYTNNCMNLMLVLFCFSMCGYVFYKIQCELKRSSRTSQNIKMVRLEKQVTRLMIVQSILPLIVTSIPFIVVSGCAQFNISMPRLGYFNSILATWNGTIKTIATICVIPNYRNFVYKKIQVNRVISTYHTNDQSLASVSNKINFVRTT